MGAGFSDQGFVEYFFGLERRTAKLVSKWSCPRRLHYLHFNVPPKPWQCPDSPKCDAGMPIQWDAPKETMEFRRPPLRQGLVVAVCCGASEVETGGLRGALPAGVGCVLGKAEYELARLRVHAALRPPLGGPLRCGRRLM